MYPFHTRGCGTPNPCAASMGKEALANALLCVCMYACAGWLFGSSSGLACRVF